MIQCSYSCICYFESVWYRNCKNVVVCVAKPIGMSDSVYSEHADSNVRGTSEYRIPALSQNHKQKCKAFEL